jgi:hypothetical protein
MVKLMHGKSWGREKLARGNLKEAELELATLKGLMRMFNRWLRGV